jgi:hypothetical protein
MFNKIAALTIGVLFLLMAAGYAAAGQGKGAATAGSRQVSSQTRSQFQKQIQVGKNCEGPQIKTQTRKRTKYIK